MKETISKKLLPNVTLLGVDCVDIDRLIRAVDICTSYMDFKEVKILTSISTDHPNAIKINPLTSREAYSEFMIKKLNEYVDTEFVLVIQYDGFILKPVAWSDDFLKYDYIGAPWWYVDGSPNVGNGGFSMRSKKLLEILANDPHITDFHPEDDRICRFYGNYLKEKGIVFALDEVARRFSVETFKTPRPGFQNKWEDQFGFHGYYTDITEWLKDHSELTEIMETTFASAKIARKLEKERNKYIIKETPEGKTFSKKAKQGEILLFREVLSIVAPQYNPQFSLLQLPAAVSIDETHPEPVLTLPFYEGENFNEKWDESNGGLPLGLDLSIEFPAIIRDLSKIDIQPIIENPRLKDIPKFSFDHQSYLLEFDEIVQPFMKHGLLAAEEIAVARKLLETDFDSPRIFNNGDFYPRNLIRMSNSKIVLIDWETWNANSRANMIDHIENVAAFCFVHMWGNKRWQENYVRELRKIPGVTREGLQKGILIKSIEMASFWFKEDGRNELCRNQLRTFKDSLNQQYLNGLWNGSSSL